MRVIVENTASPAAKQRCYRFMHEMHPIIEERRRQRERDAEEEREREKEAAERDGKAA
jgi:hypothetical protein